MTTKQDGTVADKAPTREKPADSCSLEQKRYYRLYSMKRGSAGVTRASA